MNLDKYAYNCRYCSKSFNRSTLEGHMKDGCTKRTAYAVKLEQENALLTERVKMAEQEIERQKTLNRDFSYLVTKARSDRDTLSSQVKVMRGALKLFLHREWNTVYIGTAFKQATITFTHKELEDLFGLLQAPISPTEGGAIGRKQFGVEMTIKDGKSTFDGPKVLDKKDAEIFNLRSELESVKDHAMNGPFGGDEKMCGCVICERLRPWKKMEEAANNILGLEGEHCACGYEGCDMTLKTWKELRDSISALDALRGQK